MIFVYGPFVCFFQIPEYEYRFLFFNFRFLNGFPYIIDDCLINDILLHRKIATRTRIPCSDP